MAVRTELAQPCPEKATYRVTATITDEAGAALPAASLSTLTLTIYVPAPNYSSILGSTSILNTGRGVVDSSGVLTLTLTSADTAIVNAGLGSERHILLLEWSYSSGTKFGKAELVLTVANLEAVS